MAETLKPKSAIKSVNPAGAKTRTVGPKAASPKSITDARTEAFITDLMSRMSLEEKVGQTIMADGSAITPDELRKYPLGSVEAGGNTAPGGDDRAAPAKWVDWIKAYRAVALEKRDGHTAIPIIFGIDAVHGHNNVVIMRIAPRTSSRWIACRTEILQAGLHQFHPDHSG